jgi:membrane protein DedA with SNARE-associated domain
VLGSADPMEHFGELVKHFEPMLDRYGYWAVFGIILGENFALPIPGETILIASALLAGHGKLNIVAVLLAAWLASVLGGIIGFVVGRVGGHRLLKKFGPYVRLTAERLKKTEDFFARYGAGVVVIGRFFEGIRQIYAILAGSINMSWRNFLVSNAVGATLWVGVWGGLVYWLGRYIAPFWRAFQSHQIYFITLFCLLLALVAYLAHRHLRRSETPPV